MTVENVFIVNADVMNADWTFFDSKADGGAPRIEYHSFGVDTEFEVSQNLVDMLNVAFPWKDFRETRQAGIHDNTLEVERNEDGSLSDFRIDFFVGYKSFAFVYDFETDNSVFIYGQEDDERVYFSTQDVAAGKKIASKIKEFSVLPKTETYKKVFFGAEFA